MNNMNELDANRFETFVSANKLDEKGRVIGWIVGLNEAEGKFYAWVQKARQDKKGWRDFGPFQRSKEFPSMESARAWAYGEAKRRIAALN